MSKTTTIFTLALIFTFFCLGFFSFAIPGTGELDLKFTGQIMSAEVQGVPLRVILEKIEREKGIWFKGDESVLERSVSIRFTDLPLDIGLRRILSGVNHVLFFDQDRGLVGLFVLGEKGPGEPGPRVEPLAIEKALPSEPPEDAAVAGKPSEIPPHPFPSPPRERKSPDTTTGEHFQLSPFSGDSRAETTDEAPLKPFSPQENPFTRRSPPSAENPFERSTPPSLGNPPNENTSSGPEMPWVNPFEGSQ